MSCYGIQYVSGGKNIFPINDEKIFRLLRDTPHNVECFRKALEGDKNAKHRLVQMAFNIVGPKGQKLKETCMYGNSFFFDYDDPDTRDVFIEKCLARKDEAGLLFLELSAHGAHAVFRRESGKTILENQARIASLLGCEWDNQTKDAQRVVYCSPSKHVLFVHPDLFVNTVEDESAAKAEYVELQEKATHEHAKRDKHCSAEAVSGERFSRLTSFEGAPLRVERLDEPSGRAERPVSGERLEVLQTHFVRRSAPSGRASEEQEEESTLTENSLTSHRSPITENPLTAHRSPLNENSLTAHLSPLTENSLTSNRSPLNENSLTSNRSPLTENSLTESSERCAIDYSAILPKFFQLENPLYPNIVEGMRNDTLFGVCAKYLRYCCDHNFDRMKRILYPDFSFGLPEAEVEKIIRSALSRERSLTPKIVKKLLAYSEGGEGESVSNSAPSLRERAGGESTIRSMYGMEDFAEGEGEVSSLSFEGIYPSVEDCIADELLMPKLPKFLDIALKCAPVGQKFVALGAAVPALMTLLTNCSCKFGSKAISRLNGWSHVDGPPAAGKALICKPIELLLTPIREQDDRNMQLFNRAAENRQNNPNAEKMDPIPRVGIRILVADTTRKAHITMMHLLEPKHTYTLSPELSSLRMSGFYDRKDFTRLLFDNGIVGTNTNMDNSPKISTPCNWNVTTSSTRDQTLSFWKNVTDGSVTRVLYLLMPDTTFSEIPNYVQYTPVEKEYVIRASRVLMQLSGLVQTPRLSNALLDWLHRILEETKEAGDTIRAILRKRSADIAFYFASVIHLCYCAQQILDEEDALRAKGIELQEELNAQQRELSPNQDRVAEVEQQLIEHQQKVAAWKGIAYDLSRFSEKRAVSEMANYVADYCLDSQCQIWGQRMKTQLHLAYQGTVRKEKKDDRYDRAPETFTVEELHLILPEMSHAAVKKMIGRWMASKLIVKIGTNKQIATYRKI